MTEEQFAESVAKLVAKARKSKVSNDDLIKQLEAVIDGLDSGDDYDWSEHTAA